jgi:hypothetical protein
VRQEARVVGEIFSMAPGAGVCGQKFSNTRISYYAAWIDSVTDADLNGSGGH